MIITCKEAVNGSDLGGLTLVVDELNKWGLAGQFGAYLRSDPNIGSPAASNDGKISIKLNIAVQERASEFNLNDD
jgi:hypothetical protein